MFRATAEKARRAGLPLILTSLNQDMIRLAEDSGWSVKDIEVTPVSIDCSGEFEYSDNFGGRLARGKGKTEYRIMKVIYFTPEDDKS